MKYTEFKGLQIPRLGFGTMRLPMDAQGEIDYPAAKAMVDHALANGMNYLDTAYKYHNGFSETFLGKALADHDRSTYMLADKLPTWLCETEADVTRIFEEQLEKCATTYFDFYLLHCIDEESWPNIPALNMFEILKKEKEAGRIKHLGASFHCAPELLRHVLSEFGEYLEFVQLQLNYFDWEYDNAAAIHEIAVEFGKPIIIMEPVRGGMLAQPMSEEACTILDQAATDAAKRPDGSTNYVSFALRYANELPGILTTLSGMSSMEQMLENMEIFDGPEMTAEEAAAVEKAAKAIRADILIPCTACNYCYECPAGIKIPEIFKLYNGAAVKGFHNIWGSLSGAYYKMEPTASACIGCGSCESHCPQKIKIIDELKKVDAKYAHLKEIGE